MGLRKVNTIGIKQANKGMHLAATAYNLKKYLNFITKRAKSQTGVLAKAVFSLKWPSKLKISPSYGHKRLPGQLYRNMIKKFYPIHQRFANRLCS